MRVLLDTNIIIDREKDISRVNINDIHKNIGELYKLLDDLGYKKYIHPLTIQEFKEPSSKDGKEELYKIKLSAYYELDASPSDEDYQNKLYDYTKINKKKQINNKIDNELLYQVYIKKVDYFITEEKELYKEKSNTLNFNNKVFSIEDFIKYGNEVLKKRIYKPFLTFDEFVKDFDDNSKFYENQKTKVLKGEICNLIENEVDHNLRFLGLVGLGKTRIVLETIKLLKKEIQEKVLYLDLEYIKHNEYNEVLTTLINKNDKYKLILDNCNYDHHVVIKDKLKNSKIKFISMHTDVNEEKKDNFKYIQITPNDTQNITGSILSEKTTISTEEVLKYLGNIPLLSKIFIKNYNNFYEVPSIENNFILSTLLGDGPANIEKEKVRKILRASAIFEYFGYYDDFEKQLNFIATNTFISKLDSGSVDGNIDDFKRVCNYYLDRGLFIKKGRLISLFPFVAQKLAEEWFETCNEKNFLNLILVLIEFDKNQYLFQNNLLESFLRRIKIYENDDTSKVYNLIASLLRENGIFETLKIENTDTYAFILKNGKTNNTIPLKDSIEGFNLLKTFVRVNRRAVAKYLERYISNLSKNEIQEIHFKKIEIIASILLKICYYDEEIFETGAKLLFKLFAFQNSSTINTNFINLFHIILPNTKVNLDTRQKIIEWALNKKELEYHKIAIKLLESSLEALNFNFSFVASGQVISINYNTPYNNEKIKIELKKPKNSFIEDYFPKAEEVKLYWQKSLKLLKDLILKNEILAEESSRVFTDCFRGLISAKTLLDYRLDLNDELNSIIEEIIEVKKNDWDDLRRILIQSIKFENQFLSESDKNKINEWIDKLTKFDFKTKLENIGTGYYEKNLDFMIDFTKGEERTKELAKEFYENKNSLLENIRIISQLNTMYTPSFGNYVFEISKSNKKFISTFIKLYLEGLNTTQEKNGSIKTMIGFLLKADTKYKNLVYKKLYKNKNLHKHLFEIIPSDKNGFPYLKYLIKLIQKFNYDIEWLNFKYHNLLINLDFKKLIKLSNLYIKLGTRTCFIFLEFLRIYEINKLKNKEIIFPIYKTIIYKLGIKPKCKNYEGFSNYINVIVLLLENEIDNKFILFINNEILDNINIFAQNHGIQAIYSILLKKYFEIIWPELSKLILREDILLLKSLEFF